MTTRAFAPVRTAALTVALTLAAVGPGAPACADGGDRGRSYTDDGGRDTGYRDDGYRDDGYRSGGHHDDEDDHDHDHDRARRAMEAGEVLPLAEILAHLRAVAPGRVIETDLKFDDGRYVYDFTLVSPDGRLMEAEVNAATGRLIELENED